MYRLIFFLLIFLSGCGYQKRIGYERKGNDVRIVYIETIGYTAGEYDEKITTDTLEMNLEKKSAETTTLGLFSLIILYIKTKFGVN